LPSSSIASVEVGEGVVVVVQRDVGDAAAVIGLRAAFERERNRLGEVFDRRIVLVAAQLIDQATVVIGATDRSCRAGSRG
jgi:hypothetical protein